MKKIKIRLHGRPGWHIECSTMSLKYLKTETLDIHAGGRDLIFPHHENEIAQAEALTGKTFAKYWIHHGLLTINGQKMAKSLGNFVTIKDIIKKYKPNALKLFFLSARYGNPLDFTWDKLDEAAKQLKKIEDFFDRTNSLNIGDRNKITSQVDEVNKIRDRFITAMDDDFNTPEGLACIFELLDLGNQYISKGREAEVAGVKSLLEELLDVLGLSREVLIAPDVLQLRVKLQEPVVRGDKELPARVYVLNKEEINSLIEQRDDARKKKDFKKADEIRKKLEQKGIILEDTKTGTIWRRK
jgi:cysteinyl-tRNA synthetase